MGRSNLRARHGWVLGRRLAQPPLHRETAFLEQLRSQSGDWERGKGVAFYWEWWLSYAHLNTHKL